MTDHTASLVRAAPAARPDRTEAAEYCFRYIDRVPQGDILGLLEAQYHVDVLQREYAAAWR